MGAKEATTGIEPVDHSARQFEWDSWIYFISELPSAGLDGPSRTIIVEPVEQPQVEPVREEPGPEREPAPVPEREPEKVPA